VREQNQQPRRLRREYTEPSFIVSARLRPSKKFSICILHHSERRVRQSHSKTGLTLQRLSHLPANLSTNRDPQSNNHTPVIVVEVD
jgi:hypothetical protein